jgi:hypothetical protein
MTSQLPWKVEIFGDRLDKHIRILDANDSVICILPPRQMSNGYPPQELREKSAFIVRACNNHERLVDLLNSVLSLECMRDGTEIMLKNAIQQALQST